MKKQTEKELEKNIILNLKMLGFYVYKTASAGSCYDYNLQFNEAGIADLIVIGGKNKVTFLEVKPPTKRNVKDGGLTGKQPEFKNLCKKHCINYAIVYSVKEALDAVR